MGETKSTVVAPTDKMQMTQMTKMLFENFQEFSVMNPSPKLGSSFLGRYVKYKRENI